MNGNINKAKLEMDKGNYEKALQFLNSVRVDDGDYKISLIFKVACLIKLEDYDDALVIINPLISEDPYSEFLWFNKVLCHVFLHDKDNAFKALSEAERVADECDKNQLLFLAKMYNLLSDESKALKYCDMALAIDENYVDALHEKSLVSLGLKDAELINEVADRLLPLVENNILSRLPIFLLKLFSKNYQDCYDLIVNTEFGDVGAENAEMYKGAIFNHICDDFNIDLLLVNAKDLPMDEALHILFNYIDTGNDHGSVGEIQYFILQRT